MDRLISEQAVLEAFREYQGSISDFYKAVKAIPSAEPCEDWYDVSSNEMNLEQARQAVKDLRKKLVEHLEQEPCKDVISRQAVLDITWEEPSYTDALNVLTEVRDKVKELPSVNPQEYQGSISDFYKAVKAIPSAEPKTEWIPVSERLPEERYAVLVWCPERKNIYCAYLEEGQWWIFGAYFEKVKLEVIAWMPLPPCYEPQESEG